MLKISWTDKVSNESVLAAIKEQSLKFRNQMKKQKLSYAGHVLRGSSGMVALLMLEGKLDGKRPRGRPRRTWLDDVYNWMGSTKYTEIKRMAEDRQKWRWMTHQPSELEDGT